MSASSPIILLDLNFTLVENSSRRWPYVKSGQYEAWVRLHERYRGWLIDLVRDYQVIIMTARRPHYRQMTLDSIERQHGWQPQDSCWNSRPDRLEPHEFKEQAMRLHVLPKYGEVEPGKYLAIESNVLSRCMYSRLGIHAVKVFDNAAPWDALPEVPSAVTAIAEPDEVPWKRRKPNPPDNNLLLF